MTQPCLSSRDMFISRYVFFLSKSLFWFKSHSCHQRVSIQEGTHIVCDELDTLVVMDQITRDGFESGIPGLVFPEVYMLVVPMVAKHDEEGLFEEAHTLKKEISRVALLPAQDRVFTECRMMIVVLDEERHGDGVFL